MTNMGQLFEMSPTEKEEWNQKVTALSKEKEALEAEMEEMKNNKIYENAFEWRFEFPEVLNEDGDFVGFDVVIGNPPYIQLQSIKEISEQLKQFHYETFEKTGDIYSLFYERGNQILKNNGFLAFITSNKWMRAGYGKSTRNYFLAHTQPLWLIDLGSGVFDNVTVDSNILLFTKQPFHHPFHAIDLSNEKNIMNLTAFHHKALPMAPQKDESWMIATPAEQRIKAKIEHIGKPLKEWDIQINYGIKTGYNEAFIIDGKKKDELIAQDPRSAEIIKPILRGRDIKRYKAEFADLWLIATFPALKLNIDDYPAVKAYLQSFGKRLHQTGEDFIDENGQKTKARKKTGNKWFETQDQIAYYHEFEKEKIIWKRIGSVIRFCLDSEIFFPLDSNVILTGNNIKYICGYLNSKLSIKQLLENSPKTGTGDVIISVQALEPHRVPPINSTNDSIVKQIEELVDKILEAKKQNPAVDTVEWEREINELVYRLYDLTEEEIAIVEGKR